MFHGGLVKVLRLHIVVAPDHRIGMAPMLLTNARMAAESESPHRPNPSEQVTHHFTVRRGMAVVLVIETTDWHSGLLQAALVRLSLEGHN